MKTALFFVESISLCHLARMLCLAETVKLLGIKVVFACGANHVKIVNEKGFQAITSSLVNPKTVHDRVVNFQEMYLADELENYFQHDLKLLRGIKPDLVFYDMRLTIPMLAKILDISCLSVVNGIWTKYFSGKRTAPFYLQRKFSIEQSILNKLYNYCSSGVVESIIQRSFTKGLDELYFSHGLDPLNNFAEYVSAGDVCFIADLPKIVPIENAPSSVRHIGSAIWDLPVEFKTKNIKVPQDRPSIYFSLGSSVFIDELVSPCVKKLLKAGFHIILQIGDRQIPNLPVHNELQVFNFLSNQDILPQVSLLISHGGVATSYESLLAETPFIGLPSFVDQQWNMDCFVTAKVAKSINPYSLTPDQLLDSVDEILNQEDLTARLFKLSHAIKTFPLKEIVLSNVEKLLDKPFRVQSYYLEFRQ